MNGFEKSTTIARPQPAFGVGVPGTRLSREEIDRSIARAHRLRAEEFRRWGHQVALTWASLFRRPGRMVQNTGQTGKPLHPMPQV